MDDVSSVAKKADAAEADLRDSDARVPRSGATATRVNLVHTTETFPSLPDFASGDETRLRDLIAFGMAVETGKPLGSETVADLHRKAEAELQAHAFRVLHNQVETIRRDAQAEQMGRMPRGPSFAKSVLATVVGIVLAAVLLALLFRFAPPELVAQLLAHLTPRT